MRPCVTRSAHRIRCPSSADERRRRERDAGAPIPKTPQEEAQPTLDYLLGEAALCRDLNEAIFACLESHMPPPPMQHIVFHPFVAAADASKSA